jgi:septal ring factor EnvC (AmiA/AmiB activator)
MTALAHDEQLMRLARQLAKLETKARELRRQLKVVTKDIKARRKELKAYSQRVADGNVAWNERAPKFGTLGDK